MLKVFMQRSFKISVDYICILRGYFKALHEGKYSWILFMYVTKYSSEWSENRPVLPLKLDTKLTKRCTRIRRGLITSCKTSFCIRSSCGFLLCLILSHSFPLTPNLRLSRGQMPGFKHLSADEWSYLPGHWIFFFL